MLPALSVRIEGDRLHVGERFSVSFQRTLRIPDDGGTYPLPPGLGLLPVLPVVDYTSRVPAAWSREDFFVPMYQREALWLGFDAAPWKPNAVKVGIGGIDAISGETWQPDLHADPQNYIVCPDQPWLDGINAGSGFIRQFVAMPLGSGYTVEGQLTGEERVGGLELVVFEPKPGRFPETPPDVEDSPRSHRAMSLGSPQGMGLAAGGKMKQAIYRDPNGVDTWDPGNCAAVRVHIVNSEQYEQITGRPAPPTPVTAQAYTEHGLPWFALYDETREDIAAPDRLTRVKSTGELDALESGRRSEDDNPVNVPETQIRKLKGKPPFQRRAKRRRTDR